MVVPVLETSGVTFTIVAEGTVTKFELIWS